MFKTIRIVNQDRDKVYEYTNENRLTAKCIYYNLKLMGFNLFIDDVHNLGTFDTEREVFDEIQRINRFQGNLYYVSGYENGIEDYVGLL